VKKITTAKKNPLKIFDIYRLRVNARLQNYLSSIYSKGNFQSELKNVMSYSVLAGGKRFRPILTYTTASLYDIDLFKVDACACAIELIQIYSLIHDDLPAMDNDDMRHNQPSSHKAFGEAQAILAGDGIQALAFEVLSRDESIQPDIRIELLKLLAISAYEMADGQSIDLSVDSKKVDIDIINKLIMLIVNMPKPISIIKPNITGDNALAKTIQAWSKPLILPRFSNPYIPPIVLLLMEHQCL